MPDHMTCQVRESFVLFFYFCNGYDGDRQLPANRATGPGPTATSETLCRELRQCHAVFGYHGFSPDWLFSISAVQGDSSGFFFQTGWCALHGLIRGDSTMGRSLQSLFSKPSADLIYDGPLTFDLTRSYYTSIIVRKSANPLNLLW